MPAARAGRRHPAPDEKRLKVEISADEQSIGCESLKVKISTEQQWIGGARWHHAKFGFIREFRDCIAITVSRRHSAPKMAQSCWDANGANRKRIQSRGHSTDSLRSSQTRLICERADRRLNALGWIRPQLRVIRVPPCSKPEARRDLDASLGRRMAPDTTDTTLRPLTPFRQRCQGPVSGIRGPRVSACPVPKFPDEPKFGMRASKRLGSITADIPNLA